MMPKFRKYDVKRLIGLATLEIERLGQTHPSDKELEEQGEECPGNLDTPLFLYIESINETEAGWVGSYRCLCA